jgi:hypothetical protein
VETERPPRLDAINSFLPPIEPKFDTRTNCSRNPISRKEKKRNLGRLKEEERKGKKKGGKKLRLFHKKRAKTSGVKIFTSSTLGAALQRVEPDNPEHPAHEQPSWQQHAHGPLRQAGARPQTLAGPGTKSPAEVGFLREKGANSTGGEQSSSTHGGIAADPGWGSGKELDLMGQGGGLGEREGARARGERARERGGGGGGSAYCCWVLVLVLSGQTTAWFSHSFLSSFWGFWMGVVWLCALPTTASGFLSASVGALPTASLSLSSEEGNGTRPCI